MITPEDLYTFLAQSGARVTKYPDSFRVGHPGGAIVTVEGYINLTDVAARVNRAVEKHRPVYRPEDDLQRELLTKQIQVQDAMLARLASKPARKPRKRTR
jgi:hypothetical protein